MNPPPPNDWLRRYSGEHLLHEFKMFWWLHDHIPLDNTPNGYEHDAFVESFVLHLRNLIDFFYPRTTAKKTDVIATDFMDEVSDWDSRNSVRPSLNAARLRADKELAHLTDERKYEGDLTKLWKTESLFQEIKAIAESFANKASQAKLHPNVRELLTSPPPVMVNLLGKHSHATNVTSRTVTLTPKKGH